jgi:hypothetical protein
MADTLMVAMWKSFKTQVAAYTALTTYAQKIYYCRVEKSFVPSEMPLVFIYPTRIVMDDYTEFPKRKSGRLVLEISGKVYSENPDTLVEEQLKMDDLVRNACEQDIQVAGKALIVRLGESVLTFLDQTVLDTKMSVEIETQRFTAGAR